MTTVPIAAISDAIPVAATQNWPGCAAACGPDPGYEIPDPGLGEASAVTECPAPVRCGMPAEVGVLSVAKPNASNSTTVAAPNPAAILRRNRARPFQSCSGSWGTASPTSLLGLVTPKTVKGYIAKAMN